MKIWLVNPYDNLPSEGNRAQRYWLMAEAFVRAGHRVIYWTSDFSHATKAKRVAVERGSAEGIEVVQIPTLPYGKNICLARIRSHRKLAKDFEQLAISRAADGERVDLVVASMPPLGLCDAAGRVARSCGARFVVDVQDAWPETFQRILPRLVWVLLGMVRMARRSYRAADGVIAVAERYLELARQYGSVAPMRLVGHCIEPCGRAESKKAQRVNLRLVYIGNMSLSYDLETVIKAVAETSDVTLDIAGNGPDLERLKKFSSTMLHCDAANNDHSRIKFHGYLGEAELASLLRSGDVGVVPMWPASCVGVPGKLADYAAAGLRVIESLGGECQAIVERFGAGVHYAAGEVESLKAAIAKLSRMSISAFDASNFARQFDARVVMADYVKWVDVLFARRELWVIDARTLGARPTGIGMYAFREIKRMLASARLRVILVSDVKASDEIKMLEAEGCEVREYGKRVYNSIEVIGYLRWVSRVVRAMRPDVFWQPNNLQPLAIKGVPRVVVTMHDVFGLGWNWRYGVWHLYYRWSFGRTLHNVTEVWFNSRQTQREVRERVTGGRELMVGGRRLEERVTYPIAEVPPRDGVAAYAHERPYFLYLGNVESRKGADILFAAYLAACDSGNAKPIPDLVVAGNVRNVEIPNKRGVIYRGYVDETTKWALLKGCVALIVPSRAEGYGMQLAEALLFGTRVIASDLPVFREVEREIGRAPSSVPQDSLNYLAGFLAGSDAIRINLLTAAIINQQTNYS